MILASRHPSGDVFGVSWELKEASWMLLETLSPPQKGALGRFESYVAAAGTLLGPLWGTFRAPFGALFGARGGQKVPQKGHYKSLIILFQL